MPELEDWCLKRKDTTDDLVGREGLVFGDWRLIAPLGRGGSGEVWRAANEHTGVIGALKILRAASESNLRRFLSAVEFLRSNRHPGFPRNYCVGEANGFHYAVFEELVPRELPAKDAAVASFVTLVASAVGRLHQLGFVHRDIKPANILWRGARRPVLIDLGLLKKVRLDASPAFSESEISIVEGKVVASGTVGYSAPEQFSGGSLSPATDIHALGVLADTCFGGCPPRCWNSIISRSTSSIPSKRFADVNAFVRAVRWRHAKRNAFVGAILVAAVTAVAAIGGAGMPERMRSGDWLRGEGDPGRTVLHVALGAQADGLEPDGTAKRPYATISAAIARAGTNDTIVVSPGEYRESLSVTKAPVRIKSAKGPRATVIRASRGISVVRIADCGKGTVLDGFTLTGGTGTPRPSSYGFDYYGGGVCCMASAQILNCIIQGNGKGEPKRDAATFGGGVFVGKGNVLLRNCLIRDNFAWACGGGVMATTREGMVEVDRCTVIGNASTDFFGNQGGIGLSDYGHLLLAGSCVRENSGDQVGAFGSIYANGTCAEIANSHLGDGLMAGGIRFFNVDRAMVARMPGADAEGIGCEWPSDVKGPQ